MSGLRSLTFRHPKYFWALSTILLFTLIFMAGYEYIDDRELTYAANQPNTPPGGDIYIVIKAGERLLELYSNSEIYKKYRIAVGKNATPTPIGEWMIINKSYSDKDIFGTRWMGLNVPWGCYGIHGTNSPWSIGQFASHGCIRLRNKDIEELFEWVPVDTPVKIVGQIPRITRTLQYPTSGQDVVPLQMKLRQLGYLNSRADGVFGKTTEDAVKRFQQDKKLKPNGIVDKKTLNMLGI